MISPAHTIKVFGFCQVLQHSVIFTRICDGFHRFGELRAVLLGKFYVIEKIFNGEFTELNFKKFFRGAIGFTCSFGLLDK